MDLPSNDSFNPRPPSPRGDAIWRRRCGRRLSGFNPRPPSPRGDAPMRGTPCAAPVRFNPRPPSPRGDARHPATLCHERKMVSIHAPRHRGAMHAGTGRQHDSQDVSIHAPRHRGAMPERWLLRWTSTTFQSTPPVTEGRCSPTCWRWARTRRFNPRPPSPRGDAFPAVAFSTCRYVSIHAPRHPRGDADL